MQSCWTEWHDRVIAFDLSWKNLIYRQGPHVIKFVLNATVNWVKTPDLLKLWGYSEQALQTVRTPPMHTSPYHQQLRSFTERWTILMEARLCVAVS